MVFFIGVAVSMFVLAADQLVNYILSGEDQKELQKKEDQKKLPINVIKKEVIEENEPDTKPVKKIIKKEESISPKTTKQRSNNTESSPNQNDSSEKADSGSIEHNATDNDSDSGHEPDEQDLEEEEGIEFILDENENEPEEEE